MYWDVTKVEPLPGYRIRVEFESGRMGIFDLTPYLEQGVFRELKDPANFNQVFVLFGAVNWPNEQDIAPEMLLAEMIELHDGEEDNAARSSATLGYSATGLSQAESLCARSGNVPEDLSA